MLESVLVRYENRLLYQKGSGIRIRKKVFFTDAMVKSRWNYLNPIIYPKYKLPLLILLCLDAHKSA